MWNQKASSEYLEHKYHKQNLHRHYSNLYDIGVNYHKRKPVPNVRSSKGTFQLGVEKDAKQKNLRRDFIKLENKKMLDKINEIFSKQGHYNKNKVNSKTLSIRASMDSKLNSQIRLTTKTPMNNNTQKRQLWNNKNIVNYIEKSDLDHQNREILTRIQSARSVYSVQQWKKDELKNKKYLDNIRQKYSNNDLTQGSIFCPLDSFKKAETISKKKFMYYQIEDDFDKRYNTSGRNLIQTPGSLSTKANQRAKSAQNMLNLSDGKQRYNEYASGLSTTNMVTATHPHSNNSLSGPAAYKIKESLNHKRALSNIKRDDIRKSNGLKANAFESQF